MVASCGAIEALVATDDAKVLRGRLPPTAMLIVRRWVTLRREALLANWARAKLSLWSGSQDRTMIIEVRTVRPLGDHRLLLEFSDETMGEHDFSQIAREKGPMLELLREATYFQRVFVEEGVLTWPNGFDWDSVALHDEMKQAGQLRPVGDAAE